MWRLLFFKNINIFFIVLCFSRINKVNSTHPLNQPLSVSCSNSCFVARCAANILHSNSFVLCLKTVLEVISCVTIPPTIFFTGTYLAPCVCFHKLRVSFFCKKLWFGSSNYCSSVNAVLLGGINFWDFKVL